jgi:hypothetical protein
MSTTITGKLFGTFKTQLEASRSLPTFTVISAEVVLIASQHARRSNRLAE